MEFINDTISYLQSQIYFNNSLYNYIIATLMFISVVAIISIAIRLVIRRIPIEDRISHSFIHIVVEAFRKRLIYISYALAIYAGLSYLTTPELVTNAIDKIVVIYVSLIITLTLTDILKDINTESLAKTGRNKIPAGIITIFKTLIWIFYLLFIFANLGFNVSTFITGLGIGGIAIALASQNILGDLFNYLVILFDRPFVRGDYIQFGTASGRVENVGVKSTKIRSSNGELLSVSNTDLTKTMVHNFEKATKMRKVSIIGVEYETDTKLVHEIPELLKKAVESVKNAEFLRVHFSTFNSSSLDFELIYFILSNDFNEYTKGVQEVNFAILDIFAEKGINFAYPTQRMIKGDKE